LYLRNQTFTNLRQPLAKVIQAKKLTFTSLRQGFVKGSPGLRQGAVI